MCIYIYVKICTCCKYVHIYIYIYNLSGVQGAVLPEQMPTRRRNSAMSICMYIYICCSKLIYTYMYVYTDICLADVYLYIYITVHILRCSDFFSGEEPREASPEGIYVNMYIYI